MISWRECYFSSVWFCLLWIVLSFGRRPTQPLWPHWQCQLWCVLTSQPQQVLPINLAQSPALKARSFRHCSSPALVLHCREMKENHSADIRQPDSSKPTRTSYKLKSRYSSWVHRFYMPRPWVTTARRPSLGRKGGEGRKMNVWVWVVGESQGFLKDHSGMVTVMLPGSLLPMITGYPLLILSS